MDGEGIGSPEGILGRLIGSAVSEIEADLRISPRPVIATLWGAGVVFALLSAQPDPSAQFSMVLLSLLTYGLAGLAWLLNARESWLGRWFVVAASILLLEAASAWQQADVAALLPLPIGLALLLLSFPAALATAMVQAGLLLAPGSYAAVTADGVALLAIWGVLALAYLAHRFAWLSWEQARRARRELEEVRDRRAELVKALEDREHANRQLALANERITAFRLMAEEAQKAKAAFVANVSHEFRAPLNMIIGLVGLIVERPDIYAEDLPPELWRDLQVVHRSSQHLSTMIRDVLDLSQAEAGRLGIHRQLVDLRGVVESALAVVQPLIDRKRLALRATFSDSLPEAFCDPDRVRQVVLNLVSNAARFTDSGGITVTVAPEGQNIVIAVRDTGPGIPHEDMDRVFDPFYEGATRSLRQGEGSGLGLSISKRFVELHGGRIWIESQVGAGTTVYAKLPISEGPVAPPWGWLKDEWEWRYLLPGQGHAVTGKQLRRPRVVVCDESESLYLQLQHHTDEVELSHSKDLEEASAALRECPAHVLLLNSRTSEALLVLLQKARELAPGTPVIGCVVPPYGDRALLAGAAGYLAKPVSRTDIERALASAARPVRRVLLVDDNPDMLYLMTRLLTAIDGNLELAYAATGAQALAELRCRPADLILLDIIMPDMSGWEVLAAINEDRELRKAPVYLISAHDLAELPPVSQFVLAAMDERIGIGKLLRASLTLSALLLAPD